MPIQQISYDAIADVFGFNAPCELAPSDVPLTEWSMDNDDTPILRYLFRNLKPLRHLEFGTHTGLRTALVCSESDATVWTINPWSGEIRTDGGKVYAERRDFLPFNARDVVVDRFHDAAGEPGNLDIAYLQTDARSMIGHVYREQGYGGRVNQIYCDSRDWDTRHFPDGFFDTVLIDGGHQETVVVGDSLIALRLTRPGGTILWHDFCLDDEAVRSLPNARSVGNAIDALMPRLERSLRDLIWIRPSLLLVGRLG